MMKSVIALVTILILSFPIDAQNITNKKSTSQKHTITLYGGVFDSFTKVGLPAKVTLMDSDSVVIDTITASQWSDDSQFTFTVPALPNDYIIKAEYLNYQTNYIHYTIKHIARNTYFELPDIFLKKKRNDDIYKSVDLDGVVIKGTRIKMVYKKDTIIYDASAFKLPEGSMLDALVRQLPGAQLKDNGDIYINGRKIDYLTLNGTDFFKGKNKVMLDNLPYYTVKNIKVYNKSTEKSRLAGEDIEKKDYVMDVLLKREYNQGFLGNIEMAAATSNRYLARMLGIRYTDHSRATLYTNINNINEDRKPGYNDEWEPSNNPTGLKATKSVGMEIQLNDKDKRWEESFTANANYTDADDNSKTNTTTFSNGGNILGYNTNNTRQKSLSIEAYNNIWFKHKKFYSQSELTFSYNHIKPNNISSQYTYNILGDTINSNSRYSISKYKTLYLRGDITLGQSLPWGDDIRLELNGNYTKDNPANTYTKNIINYPQQHKQTYLHNYSDNHSNQYNYQSKLTYTLHFLNKWNFAPFASYSQNFNSSNSLLFHLQQLDSIWGANIQKALIDQLPSTRELLLSTIDNDNSRRYNILQRQHTEGISIYKQKADHNGHYWRISFDVPLNNIYERLNYHNTSVDTTTQRRYTLFNPQAMLMIHTDSFYTYSIMRRQEIAVNYVSLMPFTDTSNPLQKRIANPGLKNRVSYTFNTNMSWSHPAINQHIGCSINGEIIHNNTGFRRSYNSSTGAYTLKSDNVNGNWNINGDFSFGRSIDKAKLFMVDTRTNITYSHSVDFDTQHDGESTILSKVNNWNTQQEAQITYSKGAFTLSIGGTVKWTHANSKRSNFSTINVWDYNYGLNLRCQLPFKIDLATDAKVFSRRGYQGADMNTNDMIWNASLSRSILSGNVILKLDAFDILKQLDQKNTYINSQGRYESWNNCIPRYAMMHVIYKLNNKSKKKE